MIRIHGVEPRGETRVPVSSINEGRFGRMFRRLGSAPTYGPALLSPLAESMPEETGSTGSWGQPGAQPEGGDNPAIPSGYTYFGQFIDHDITFDPNSLLEKKNDVDALHDFRTPRFDLDSLYGSGPLDEPFQYDQTPENRGLLLVGANENGEPDLPRNSQGIALIGDPRNDENTIVSQIQLAFILFHNRLFREQTDPAASPEVRFEEARKLVRWHYQWLVVNDYLKRICGPEFIGGLYQAEEPDFDLPHYRARTNAYLPVEFSAAAFRFGHSQVRSAYNLNGGISNIPVFLVGDEVGPTDDLRGGKVLPPNWTIDWSHFFVVDGSVPQPSRLIDEHLSGVLFDLPRFPADQPQSLALRNLMRGEALCLPSGQDVARHLRTEVLADSDLGSALKPTPLWFYVLRESGKLGGTQLGPVGARIVAEVLLGLFKLDPSSFVHMQPDWEPTIPAVAEPERGVTLADLLTFATDG